MSHSLRGAALLFAVLLAAPALAQGQRGPILPGEPNYPSPGPGPGPAPSNCRGWASAVTVDPSRPRTGANYHSINAALCAVMSSGTITVSSYGGRPYREEFTVSKSGLTLAAELGETVAVAPQRARCMTIAGGAASTTNVRGFAFRPTSGAGPCVDVKAGRLSLSNSRIDLPLEAATGIRVAAEASLSFAGDSYDRHGIFARIAPSLPHNTIGVSAETANDVTLHGVRIENLATGVQSRAVENIFLNVRFTGNLTAVTILDEGQPVAPTLTVAGGEFLRSNTAVRLIAGAPGADRANFFRGKVTIGGAGGRTLFYRNAKGLETDAYAFLQPLDITDTDFTENFIHALRFPLPRDAKATIKNSTFHNNGQAITITGPLDGELHVDGDIVGGAGNLGIAVGYGSGKFDAQLRSVSGQALLFGGAFLDNGTHNVVIEKAAGPELLGVYAASEICAAGAHGDWKAFRKGLASLKITVDQKQYLSLISTSSRPSKKKMQEAYELICPPPLPAEEED